jgi:hypothetical protein
METTLVLLNLKSTEGHSCPSVKIIEYGKRNNKTRQFTF